jgi:hypothetical protein
MSNPVVDLTTLLNNCAQYSQTGVSDNQQQALLLYAMALELTAIGGTNYTTGPGNISGQSGASQLIQDASTLFNGFTQDQLIAAQVNLAFIRAAAAGAVVPGGANNPGNVAAGIQLAQLGTFFFATAGFNLNNPLNNSILIQKMLVLLTAKLGRHAPYPQ